MADITKVERITATEFLEKYPETEQPIELIAGEVLMSPAPKDVHGEIEFELIMLIGNAVKAQKLGTVRTSPNDVHLDEYNIVQPDIYFVSNENQNCKREADGYIHGTPDLIVEVLSPGTSRRDRVDKFDLYEKHGVREYWMVEPQGNFIEVYVLHEGKYQRQGAYKEGESFTSTVIPSLTIKVDDVFSQEAE